MRKKVSFLLPVVVVALTVTFGCSRNAGDTAGSGEVVLRAYQVPAGVDAEAIKADLNRSLLISEDRSLGSAVVYPDGSLIVTAPPSVQKQVAKLLETLGEKDLQQPRSAPEPITLDYWVLLARPSQGARGKHAVRIDSRELRDSSLRPALDQIAEVDGPLEFRLLEKLRLTSIQGNTSTLRGRWVRVTQRTLDIGVGALLTGIAIELNTASGSDLDVVQTRVLLESGRMVVLGQSSYDPSLRRSGQAWQDSDGIYLYYVVSAEP